MSSGKLCLLLGASIALSACTNQSESRNAAKARDQLDEQQRRQQLQDAENSHCQALTPEFGADRRGISDCDLHALERTLAPGSRPLGGAREPAGAAIQNLPSHRRLGL